MAKVVAPDKAPSIWQTLVIGGVKLPGIIEFAEVFGQIEVITIGTPGEPGSIKADPKIGDDQATFELMMVDDPDNGLDHFAFFTQLRRVYKPLDAKAKPVSVQHPLFSLWGIRTMFVKELRVRYDKARKNTLLCTVVLVNNAPTKTEPKDSTGTGAKKGTSKKADAVTPEDARAQGGTGLDKSDQFTGTSSTEPPSSDPPGPTIGTK